MSEPYFFEIISGTGVIGIMSMIRYFLKKQNDKIESIDEKLRKLSHEFTTEMKLTKREVVALFHDICHERQNSCATLMETRIEGLRQFQDVICGKMDELKNIRVRDWEAQQEINDKIKIHMVKQNGNL